MALTVLSAYALYAIAMVLLHPRFIYPFFPEPFEHPVYTRLDLGNAGPVLYAHDAGEGAPVVVYFMGNVGALGPFLPMLEHHRTAGRSIVAMGYRGGGGLPGEPSETQLKSDALQAFDAVPQAIAQPGKVVVQGYSLGTGLALHVAARRDVDAVILSAPYAKLCRLMARASYLPACRLPGVQTWNSEKDAATAEKPTLVLHGTADALIPIEEGRRLFNVLKFDGHVLNRMVEIQGAGHNNLISFASYLQEIDSFVARITAQSR